MNLSLSHIQTIVTAHRPEPLSAEGLVPAAVLVPLFERDGRVHLLMEKRTQNLEHHKGQVSFPGGGRDAGDRDAEATALREAREEVGLEPAEVELWGRLDDIATITGFRVTPVVGRVPDDYAYRPSPAEVEVLLRVPLELFWDEPPARTRMEHDGESFEVVAYPFGRHHVWGATARITRSLVELLQQAEQRLRKGGTG